MTKGDQSSFSSIANMTKLFCVVNRSTLRPVERYAPCPSPPCGLRHDRRDELTRRHRLQRSAPWKQPLGRAPSQRAQFEQMWRQHHVTVFAALCLLDANDHAFAVDVADLSQITSAARRPAP